MTLTEVLCAVGAHKWKRSIEWRATKATLWGNPWPFPANVPIRSSTCKRCGKTIADALPAEVKVENEWGLSK